MRLAKNILFAMTFLVLALTGIHFYLLDGLDGLFFSHGGTFKDTTVYASGYTDAAFRKVKVGMSAAEVIHLLGPPLEHWKNCDPDNTNNVVSIGMRWSKTPCDSSYRIRTILFKGSKVIEKHSEYYID